MKPVYRKGYSLDDAPMETQAILDRIENGTVRRPGCFAPVLRAMREPSSKCCREPLVRRSADTYCCLGCKQVFTARRLEALGIDPTLIG